MIPPPRIAKNMAILVDLVVKMLLFTEYCVFIENAAMINTTFKLHIIPCKFNYILYKVKKQKNKK